MASEWRILMSRIAHRPILIINLFEIFTISLLSTLSLWNCVTIQCVHFRLNRENIDAKRHRFIIAISRCFPSFTFIAYYTCTCNQTVRLITSLYEPLYDSLYKRSSYIYISMLISNRLFITNEHSLNSMFYKITRCDESIESMLFLIALCTILAISRLIQCLQGFSIEHSTI